MWWQSCYMALSPEKSPKPFAKSLMSSRKGTSDRYSESSDPTRSPMWNSIADQTQLYSPSKWKEDDDTGKAMCFKETLFPRVAMRWTSICWRSRGRPKEAWCSLVQIELGKEKWNMGQVQAWARGRLHWQSLVTALCASQCKEDYVSKVVFYNCIFPVSPFYIPWLVSLWQLCILYCHMFFL